MISEGDPIGCSTKKTEPILERLINNFNENNNRLGNLLNELDDVTGKLLLQENNPVESSEEPQNEVKRFVFTTECDEALEVFNIRLSRLSNLLTDLKKL